MEDLAMPTYFCMECWRTTEHLNVTRVAQFVGVTRATMYNWIKKAQVHTVVHPSGRILVCTSSLLTPGFARFPGERAAALAWQPQVRP